VTHNGRRSADISFKNVENREGKRNRDVRCGRKVKGESKGKVRGTINLGVVNPCIFIHSN
jgi:hypothetical protein